MRVYQKISVWTCAALVLAFSFSSLAKTHKSTEFPTIGIKNFGRVNDNYYRGAQPEGADFKALADLGVKTIIDLRDDRRPESKGLAEDAGLKYVNIGMDDRKRPSEEQVQEFMKIANDPASQPVYVHCAGGRHRTGLVTAVYRMEKDGWDVNQAYGEMKEYDFSYGFGHGPLKEYVFDYYSKKEQNSTIGVSSTTEALKKKK